MDKKVVAEKTERTSKADIARQALLVAAKTCLLDSGFANLSTRKVAEIAGMPVSQIHYHFKSKSGLILALLRYENEKLLERQHAMYAQPLPLSARWRQACDYLEEDMRSGYVRTLHEMIAAAWSDADLAEEVRAMLTGWAQLLSAVIRDAEHSLGTLAPLTAEELAGMIGALFLGVESILLLGEHEKVAPALSGLRKLEQVFETLERERGMS